MGVKILIDRRIRGIKPSAALSFNERVHTLWHEGRKIYHFGFGESRFPGSAEIKSALKKNADESSYEPVGGNELLRNNIASYWNNKFNTSFRSSNVLVGTGSKILFHDALRVIEGDLILPIPTWVSYEPQARMLGKKVIWVQTEWKNNCCIDTEDLIKQVKQSRMKGRTPKVLLITNPGNPTGTEYSKKQIADLARVCRKLNIMVISDEIYAQINHGIVPHTCFAKYYPEGTIVTSGLSKAFSLGGWRLGFALLPENEIGNKVKRYMKIIAGSSWSVASSPVQHAATVAFSLNPKVEKYLRTCTEIHSFITQYFYGKLSELGFDVLKPHSGFYVYVDFSRFSKILKREGVNNSTDLSNYLLEKYNIAALPGGVFGENPKRLTLRIATSYIYAPTKQKAENFYNAFIKSKNKIVLGHDQFVGRFLKNHAIDIDHALSQFQQLRDKIKNDQE